METRIFTLISMLGLLYLLPDPSLAQATRSDSEMIGSAAVTDSCLFTPLDMTKDDGQDVRTESALGLAGGSFLAGMAGDLVTAGLDSLGAALEEASREKGFSVLGTTSFAYYRIDKPDASTFNQIKVTSALTPGASKCLILSFKNPTKKPAPFSTDALVDLGLNLDKNTEWPNYGLPANPDVYVEAELQKRQDGFVVRPVLVWYRNVIPGAPKRALPAELHVIFSVPAAPTGDNGSGTVFALARIRFPNISPGTVLVANDLKSFSSSILLERVTTGSPETVRQQLTAALANLEANTKSIATLEKALKRAKAIAEEADATQEEKTNVIAIGDQLDEAKAETKKLQYFNDKALKMSYPIPVGSTNVQVRLTIIRNANKFGLAVAKALQARSKTLGEAVTNRLAPQTRASAWTAADTNYVTAMTAVENAQRSLDIAIAKGDATEIFAAQIALKNAKAAANAAAAASDRPIPYPNLI
ncbi:MAG: hypothetical protein ACREO1_15495 [Arenimonas sp.]